MSIQKESYYKLVKISDLAMVNRNTFVQIIGKITLIDDTKMQINDSFGTHTIEIGKNPDISFKPNSVIRVFGNWDGIKIFVEKILDWNIAPDKIPILFTSY